MLCCSRCNRTRARPHTRGHAVVLKFLDQSITAWDWSWNGANVFEDRCVFYGWDESPWFQLPGEKMCVNPTSGCWDMSIFVFLCFSLIDIVLWSWNLLTTARRRKKYYGRTLVLRHRVHPRSRSIWTGFKRNHTNTAKSWVTKQLCDWTWTIFDRYNSRKPACAEYAPPIETCQTKVGISENKLWFFFPKLHFVNFIPFRYVPNEFPSCGCWKVWGECW